MSQGSLWERVDAYEGNYPHARREAFRRSNYSCQFCGAKVPLEAHHWTTGFYPSGDRVTADDLTALCKPCHDIATSIRGMLHAGCPREQLVSEFEQAVNERQKWQALLRWTSTAKSARDKMIEEDAMVAARKTRGSSHNVDVGQGCGYLAANMTYTMAVIAVIALIGWLLSFFS